MTTKFRITAAIELPCPHQCPKCRRWHEVVPAGAIQLRSGEEFDGYYWACVCGDHLWVPSADINSNEERKVA